MTRLNWQFFDKDLIASNEKFVFILKYGDIGVYGYGKAYALKVKKFSDVEFKSCGIIFVVKSDGYNIQQKKSLNNKIWGSVQAIQEKAEEYLKICKYI